MKNLPRKKIDFSYSDDTGKKRLYLKLQNTILSWFKQLLVEPNVFRRNPKPENVPIVVGLQGMAKLDSTLTPVSLASVNNYI